MISIESINPATLEKIGEIKVTPVEIFEKIFNNAKKAQKKWRKLTLEERSLRIARSTKIIAQKFDEISLIISEEVGKPPSEAFISEVYGAIDSTFHYYTIAKEIIGKKEEIDLGLFNSFDKTSYIVYKEIGVVSILGPYNYPFIIPFEQCVQALIAGNAVVFKPSSETIFVGKMIQEIFNSLDIPKDLFQIVFGSGSKIGNILIDYADLVIFTGSTDTGKKVMKRAADTLTPVLLELGGKSAMVVLPDANIKRAVLAARWGVFTNSGQVCASVKRLYLHKSIYKMFLEELVKKTGELKQGNPLQPGIDVGAMINAEQLNKVHKMVIQGIKEGARILIGGRPNPNLNGYFYEPTILADASNNMEIVQNEIFGPVLVVIPFESNSEVIEMVNDNKYGLISSVWSRNITRAEEIAHEINTGTVMINEVDYTFALAATPWGGTKHSGIGRTHGKLGFLSMVRPLHINIDQSEEADLWWMPYNKDFEEVVNNFKIIAKNLVVE